MDVSVSLFQGKSLSRFVCFFKIIATHKMADVLYVLFDVSTGNQSTSFCATEKARRLETKLFTWTSFSWNMSGQEPKQYKC